MSGVETNVGTKGWIFVEKARHSPPEVKIPITVLFGRGVSNLASLREFLEWSGNIVVGGGGYATIIINGSEQRVRGAVEVYDILRVPENYAWAMDYFYSKCEDYFQYWVEQSTYPDKP